VTVISEPIQPTPDKNVAPNAEMLYNKDPNFTGKIVNMILYHFRNSKKYSMVQLL
jgi:hypothetical protein